MGKRIDKRLLAWFDQHGRHDLPWQTGQPYHVWLSEIMLQQTQVTTVIPYFQRFTKRFPTLESLAKAPLDAVLTHWAGLGYYARARNLHKTAKQLCAHFGGEFPKDLATLISLPGIGRSTAGAIAAQAFHQRTPILDGNVKRVLSRLYEVGGAPTAMTQTLWQLADTLTPSERVADYTQAIMDLGATVCTRRQPQCGLCPLKQQCLAHLNGTTNDYPPKKAKSKIPEKFCQWLILIADGQDVYIKQRQEKLWGGLWVFPEIAAEINAKHFLRAQYALSQYKMSQLAPLTHTFTHFKLHIQPIRFDITHKKLLKKETPPSRWVKLRQIESLAIPTPMGKVLNQLVTT